jgi:hypothetical protein
MDVGFIWVLLIASVARLLGFHIHDDMREKAGVTLLCTDCILLHFDCQKG